MSGLVAVRSRDGAQADDTLIATMCAALEHRAPDGVAAWRSTDGAMAAAHLHAWSTPEEVGERQPLVDESIALLWDGRLDNRPELARRLGEEELGRRGVSDATLVLRAYKRWGPAMPGYLLGSFALVVMDAPRHTVLLARDAVGARTLCWHLTERQLLVASEPFALLAAPEVDGALDETWLACHFALAPAADGRTIFRGVREQRAGEATIVTPDAMRTERFWSADPTAELSYRDDREYAEHFGELLRTAVRRRMRARGGAGVLMSGGLDSAPVAALAAEELRRTSGQPPVKTFSYVFDDFPACDERAYVAAMADHCGLDAFLVRADDEVPLGGFPNWAVSPNAPEGNVYRNLMDLIFGAAARSGTRVLLAGYWGDRYYTGVEHWLSDLLSHRRFGDAWRDVRAHAGRHGWGRVARSRSVRQVLRDRLAGPDATGVQVPPWLTDRAADLVEAQPALPVWTEAARRPDRHRTLLGAEPAAGALQRPFHEGRHGLEVRDPYRDRDLIEFILQVPAYVLYLHGDNKAVMRNAMRGLLPELVRTRPAPTRFSSLLAEGLALHASDVEAGLDGCDAPWQPFVRADWVAQEQLGSSGQRAADLVLWHCMSFRTWMARRPARPTSAIAELTPAAAHSWAA